MKRSKSMLAHSTLAVTLVALGAGSPLSSVQAQSVAADVANAARDGCIRVAESKGFQVNEVVSIEPDGTDGAKAVLSLTREGQLYKLTCGYTRKAGAVFGETSPVPATTSGTTTTTAAVKPGAPASLLPLWWLLLPLLGLPLLLWFLKNRGEDRVLGGRSDALVRGDGESVDYYADAGTHYEKLGSLYDGQRVTLSGRYREKWAELASGGWVPTQYLETTLEAGRYIAP